MKNAKLIIDGKEIEIMISEDELNKWDKLSATNKMTGYERARYGSTYYTENCGTAVACTEYTEYSKSCGKAYESGNYYSDPDVAINNARADNLMRQLRRFAIENRKVNIDWDNDTQDKYHLRYDYLNKEIYIAASTNSRDFVQIYFDTGETAKLAVEKFKDELLWYFTEYRDSL